VNDVLFNDDSSVLIVYILTKHGQTCFMHVKHVAKYSNGRIGQELFRTSRLASKDVLRQTGADQCVSHEYVRIAQLHQADFMNGGIQCVIKLDSTCNDSTAELGQKVNG
jgi:hypothetical protein